jgi:hypothetical protein
MAGIDNVKMSIMIGSAGGVLFDYYIKFHGGD